MNHFLGLLTIVCCVIKNIKCTLILNLGLRYNSRLHYRLKLIYWKLKIYN